jgi:hypothetical protein
MLRLRKFLKYTFAVAFMTNVCVFCVGIALGQLEILVLPAMSMPLCLWGVELHSEKEQL